MTTYHWVGKRDEYQGYSELEGENQNKLKDKRGRETQEQRGREK